MKVTELDTKEVTVTMYVLNEKVFELDGCPEWAQYAAVDEWDCVLAREQAMPYAASMVSQIR